VLAVSAVFAAAVLLIEYNRIGGLVADRAQRSVAFLNAQVQHLLDRPGLLDAAEFQDQLERMAANARGQKIGRFVYVEISDLGTLELARMFDRDYAHAAAVEVFMSDPSRRLPQDDGDYYESVSIKDTRHVYTVVPLVTSAGDVVAFARGMFALSDEAYAQIWRRISTVVGLTVAVIIVTALLLYPIIARLMGQLEALSSKLLDANLEMIEVLGSAIAKRDSDTDVHNYRVSIYSVRLAERIGLDRAAIRSLIKGAFLHDVGKIGTSDNILLKPGRLDEAEFEIMKQHVRHGLDIVARSEWLTDAAAVVGFHHEKYDGSGYHENLAGNDIPLNARIFAIADVFDALTSERPYKKPLGFDEAMRILKEGGGNHFDPSLVEAFAGIAPDLHRAYANRDDESPRKDLADIVDEYFRDGAELIGK
jgi:HD-GYP domain-containing protein (c-di-GMP phosphodiesterase class II)